MPVGNTRLSFCSSLCRENFCNLNECRSGNINNTLRCLSCGLVDNPNDCKVVKECLEGEICLAEKIETFGKSKYRLGCVRHQDCSLRRISTSQIIGKRTAVQNCSVCCKTDYCNLDACSANMSAQILQLNPVSPNAVCEDDDPKLCATLGRFNADACSDPYVVEKCPKSCVACDHFGWTEWGSYSYCSQTCSFGTKTRKRECYHRLDISMNKTCVGNATEQEQCYIIMDCPPVNGGWCYREMTPYCNYNAAVAGACLSPYLVRSNCACPPPQYGGLPCR
ncbi:thrombospondin-2-like isoform X2 [Ruditapes philippinarum]|uniref:thrombospondin-2-like isoform X2 n=1 Tax=Ruditapes philippinarum TaxID=129788 RepID=UPI00295AE64F|nr:thrombospondin-2-like isoform X2 [Ruditapes philippinarum]